MIILRFISQAANFKLKNKIIVETKRKAENNEKDINNLIKIHKFKNSPNTNGRE